MVKGKIFVLGAAAAVWMLTVFPASAAVLDVCKQGCAYRTIQGGINAAVSGDEVVVRPGVWKERITFKGKNITVRSRRGADYTVIDGEYLGPAVRFDSGEGPGAVLYGFTITGGRYEGGIYVNRAAPTIKRCVVAGNVDCGFQIWGTGVIISECLVIYNYDYNSRGGGGIWLQDAPEAQVLDSVIAYNSTQGYGGGLHASYSDGAIVRNCTIFANTAEYGGGGVNCWSNVLFDRNVISGNTTRFRGGGMMIGQSAPTLTNCLISGNRDLGSGQYGQLGRGGGVYVDESSSPLFANCTIVGNIADRATGAGIFCKSSSTTIVNSIIRGNKAGTALGQLRTARGTITASYSNIQGGWAGTGNIDANPLFVSPAPVGKKAVGFGDYHLQQGSPCQNSGTDDLATYPFLPLTDIDGEARPFDSVRDMGADEVGSSPPPIPVVNVAVSDYIAAEPGPNRGEYVINTDSVVLRPMVFFYKMRGTARNGSDYIRLWGDELMPAGYDGLILSLRPKDDTLRENTETAIMELRPAMTYRLSTPRLGAVRIRDDD